MSRMLRGFNSATKGRRKAPSVIKFRYKPFGRQNDFHQATERYKLYGGAMGGGKTYALCGEVLRLCLKYPGNRGYFCRQAIFDFVRSTLLTFERICPKTFVKKHYRDERVILFANGSEIAYGGLGGEQDLERIKSTEFGFFAIDEATETMEEMFLLLCSRLRWTLPGGDRPKYHGILASNPEPGWVKARFVDQKLQDHVFIPALPKDNPKLPKDYDANLRAIYPEEWIKRYLDGSWDLFEGQIYKEFDRRKHVFDHDLDTTSFNVFRSMDHGYTNPTSVHWYAVDFDGCMWVYDEHYERELTIPEHAAVLKTKDPSYSKGVWVCDPSMFSKTMQKGTRAWTPADEYREQGIVLIKPYHDDGKISEALGINLVKQRLKQNKLMIHKSCTHMIREILGYRWRDIKMQQLQRVNAPEIPMDKDNHAMDDLRYANIWKPVTARPPKKPVDTRSVHYAILEHKRQLRQQRFIGW